MRNLSFSLPLFAALSLLAFAGASAGEPPKIVEFKKVPDGKPLHLHVFSPEEKAGQPRAAVVFFFGGGWVGGTPTQFYPYCEHLAKRGMVAVTAEYRTKKSHGTDPFACVEDGKSAMRWVRDHAADLGVDPDRIAAGGGSAGGHVALAVTLLDGFDAAAEKDSPPARPAALALFNPVCDTGAQGWPGGFKQLGDRWEELSPYHHLKEGALPPTIFFHGEADSTVPFENAERFAKRAKEVGAKCELVPYPKAGHGFFNKGRGGSDDAFQDTLRRTDAFFTALGFLPKSNAE